MTEPQTERPQEIQKQKRKYVRRHLKAVGRPGKFGQIKIPQLRKILELGATDEQIASFFNISYGSLKSYKKDNPEFSAALKEWKRQADERVIDSLFHKALGYEHPSEEIHIIKNKVVRVAMRKIYPPDTTAQIFWLKNRQPEQWRDKQTQDGSAVEKHYHYTTIQLSNKSEQELMSNLLGRTCDTQRQFNSADAN